MKTSSLHLLATTTLLVTPLAQGFASFSSKHAASSSALKMASSESAQQKPWDALRFVQQSSKFVRFPFSGAAKERVVQPGDVLWEPSSKADFTMAPLDDVVMGGASSSQFNQEMGVWTGQVTDANNGGFIGIRSTPSFSFNMEQCKGIEIKLRGGNGKRFKFVVRDSTDFNGICWSTSANVGSVSNSNKNPVMSLFKDKDTTDSTTTVRIPFDKQIPTLFARTVPDQNFKKQNVVGFQVAYSKFEYDGELNSNFELGDVSLQILEIRAY